MTTLIAIATYTATGELWIDRTDHPYSPEIYLGHIFCAIEDGTSVLDALLIRSGYERLDAWIEDISGQNVAAVTLTTEGTP